MDKSRAVGWRDWHRKSLETRQAKARARSEEVLPLIHAWRQDGRNWVKVAELLDAAGIPTSFAGYGQNGCAASCACCCRASRGIFAATKCQDSRAARVRHRCFTRRVHGTTWAPSAAGKSHTRLGKVTQRALSEPSGWIP